MSSKLKEKIDVAIKGRKRLEQELAERDKEIERLLKELAFHKSQSEKVEGLIDENIKLANKLEDAMAENEEAVRLLS